MDKVRKTLEKLWLNKNEIRIYLTSLSIWQSPASILWNRNNLTRSTAQYTCQSLVDKRLFNHIKKWNTFLYSAENPEKLLTLLSKEYDELEKKMEDTQSIIWDLIQIKNKKSQLPKVKYFTGVDGIIDLLNDALIDWKDLYGYFKSDIDLNWEVLSYIKNDFLKERVKKWMHSTLITNNIWLDIDYYNKNLKRNTLCVSSDDYLFHSCMHIYGDKIAFYSYLNSDLSGVIIENHNMAKSHLTLFKLAFEQARLQND